MLPYLKPKSANTSTMIVNRKPDAPKDEEDQGLEACCQDIISAVEAKDAKRLAQAFKDAFTMCESSPEYPSDEQESE